MKISNNIIKKCKKIKLVITDVDGVLTDGGRYYSDKGEIIKKFHVRDGMGINILLRNNIKTVILSKENSPIVKKWAKDMNVSKLYLGIKHKEKKLSDVCKDFSLKKDEIAFIGDDVNDVELLSLVGFSATPQDGNIYAKKIVDYTCDLHGGQGAFREISDLILSIQFPKKIVWY